jgi:hypothetical protein
MASVEGFTVRILGRLTFADFTLIGAFVQVNNLQCQIVEFYRSQASISQNTEDHCIFLRSSSNDFADLLWTRNVGQSSLTFVAWRIPDQTVESHIMAVGKDECFLVGN